MGDDLKMTEVEREAFKSCVNAAFLAMDELREVLIRARDDDDPTKHDNAVLAKHEAAGEALNKVMMVLGFDADDDED